jgi:CPA2 family monovalent cation:H+ antiporter-2
LGEAAVNSWTILLDVLILLLAAMVLGGIFERLKQHAILGYLLAGTLVGPHMFNLMPSQEAITSIAELGVAFLLFMIGLEFSWHRLRSLGAFALGGGSLQVAATVVVTLLAGVILGLETSAAFAIGAMVALSSTAVVMRLLVDRAEIDSLYGRNVLGILLLQDIAVVPLVLAVTLLAGHGTATQFGWAALRALGAALLLVSVLFLVLKYLVPRLFRIKEAVGNQDLPVLLSIVTGVGSAWGAHALGLSPILGAFLGGVILAESPVANRVRADIASLKTLFMTLFFASMGMLTNPAFFLSNWEVVTATTGAILLGKILISSGVARLFRIPVGYAVATALCLAQIGEFSFVIAEVARSSQLISGYLFDLMISVTVLTLFLTPYLVASAPRVAGFIGRLTSFPGEKELDIDDGFSNAIIVIGFGPAGETVARELIRKQHPQVVIDINPATADKAGAMGIRTIIGDATHLDILKHAGVESAKAVVVTVPDPVSGGQIVTQTLSLAPNVPVLARARYNRYLSMLSKAGANVVVDEETEIGLQLFSQLRTKLHIE